MRLKKHIVSYILVIASIINMTAQEKQNWVSEHVDFSGYLKYLNTSSFTSLDSIGNDNLIHNRLNFKMYANDNLTLAIELRNRIFWGTSVKSIPASEKASPAQ